MVNVDLRHRAAATGALQRLAESPLNWQGRVWSPGFGAEGFFGVGVGASRHSGTLTSTPGLYRWMPGAALTLLWPQTGVQTWPPDPRGCSCP